MAGYIKVPTEGVINFDTVRDILAEAGGTGMTDADANSLFTKEAVKGVFAKFKPTRWNNHYPDAADNHWKAIDGFCGFNLDNARWSGDVLTAFENLSGKMDGAMNGWEYLPPRGYDVYAEPYRIDDFKGHYPEAKLVAGYSVPQKAGASLSVATRLPIDDGMSLTWGDFDKAWSDVNIPLSNFYFGAIIVRNGTTNFRARTSEDPLTQSVEVIIPTNDLADGTTWTVMPFIFSGTILNDREHDKVGIFYLVPNTQLATITKSSTKPSIIVTAQKSEPVTITVNLTILNVTDSAMRFETNTVWLIHPDSSIENPSTFDKSVIIPDFDVAANGTHTVEVKFEFLDIITYNNGLVYVTLNAGSYEYGPFIPSIEAGPKTI